MKGMWGGAEFPALRKFPGPVCIQGGQDGRRRRSLYL